MAAYFNVIITNNTFQFWQMSHNNFLSSQVESPYLSTIDQFLVYASSPLSVYTFEICFRAVQLGDPFGMLLVRTANEHRKAAAKSSLKTVNMTFLWLGSSTLC